VYFNDIQVEDTSLEVDKRQEDSFEEAAEGILVGLTGDSLEGGKLGVGILVGGTEGLPEEGTREQSDSREATEGGTQGLLGSQEPDIGLA
jgi:hypothetical protein